MYRTFGHCASFVDFVSSIGVQDFHIQSDDSVRQSLLSVSDENNRLDFTKSFLRRGYGKF